MTTGAQAGPAGMAAGSTRPKWRPVVRIGLIGAAIAVYVCLVGIVPIFDERVVRHRRHGAAPREREGQSKRQTRSHRGTS